MVKVGPKVPPPTRRELERQERELKRAQGANAAQLGEPREHLAFLVYRKSRSKRPEASALGNSWRRREKNQKRTEARRLAKAKANISSLESQEYVDISRSDLLDYDHGNAKGPTTRGDNSEAPLPYVDSSSSEIHGVVEPNDYSLGSLSGGFSSMTDTSVSISSSGNPGILGNSTSGLLAQYTTPRLGVDITTGDFWCENNALSASLSKEKEDNLSAAMKILPKEPMHTEKPAEKTIDSPKPPSQAPLPAFSRILPSRKSRTAMNAAVAPPRLSSRKSSFIFSEPLDMSKYLNRSHTPTNAYSPRIGSGTFAQGSPDLFGSLLASGKRVDTTPHIGTVHGPNLTPRAQASAYVSSKNLVKPADQSCLAGSETSYWNSRSANRNLLAVHATSARRVARVGSDSRITHVALSEDDPVKTFAKFDSVRNAFKPGILEKLSLEPKKLYNDIGIPPPLQSNAWLSSSEHELFKNNKSGILPNSPGVTPRHHNTHFSDNIQNQTGSPSSNARAGAVENPSLNGSAIVESGTPVLAPAACITHDKKTKPCQLGEIQPSLLQPRAVENGHEVSSIRYPDTPPTSCSGIVPPASTPRSPLLFALGLSSPPWSRPSILPRHTGDTNPEANTSSRGFVSALKWMLRKTLRYFWQRRG